MAGISSDFQMVFVLKDEQPERVRVEKTARKTAENGKKRMERIFIYQNQIRPKFFPANKSNSSNNSHSNQKTSNFKKIPISMPLQRTYPLASYRFKHFVPHGTTERIGRSFYRY
jgi:hypothetical protein